MKPTRIALQCFGPYPDRQEIDLTRAARDGLFLLCGDTGAGKTTLLDAMCFALYNRSSGSKVDLPSMRSQYARDGKVETFVELEVEKDGERYRFYRSVRPKKRSDGFDETHDFSKWVDGKWQPQLQNAKQKNVTEAAERLIGLNAEQFKQIVILPQGQFERLLLSDSKDKEPILSTIFGVGTWKNAVARLHDELAEDVKRLDVDRREIAARLTPYSCGTPNDLAAKIEAQRARLPELEGAKRQSEKKLENANNAVTQAEKDDALFAELDARAKKARELEQRDADILQKQQMLMAAQKAEGLRIDFLRLQRARGDERDALSALEKNTRALAKARERKARAEDAWNYHEQTRANCERAKNVLLPEYWMKEETYRLCETLSAQEAALSEAAQSAERLLAQRTDALERADTAFALCLRVAAQCAEESERVFALYRQGTASRLAQTLEAGKPCPVCGSTHHPTPAPRSDGYVTDAQWEETDGKRKLAERERDRAQKARESAVAAVNDAKIACQRTQSDVNALRVRLKEAREKRIDGIDTADKLTARIADFERRIAEYEAKEDTLKRDREEAATACAAAQGAYSEAEANANAKRGAREAEESAFRELLRKNGYTDEAVFTACLKDARETEALRTAVDSHASEKKHALEELALKQRETGGKTRPDIRRVREAAKAARQENEQTAQTLFRAATDISDMQVLYAELAKKQETLAESEKEYERRNGFYQALDPKIGMNLHRYLLAQMLGRVLDAANGLLVGVHNGRYRLYRSNDASENAHIRGLEFNVIDNDTNSERSVKSLSGGEKFLVSLALAIGLNTVMQAQSHGIRVEAIFVDEGFGSLDADSVNDAMQMLHIVRKSRGMVGVISHVDALKNEIPVHIEAVKNTTYGSTLRMSE